ncbi:MAG: hypothetical protein IT320_05325 [Anaerolineae bacterium]|nr:hypothetical protein [Anaerolineae bacterium]
MNYRVRKLSEKLYYIRWLQRPSAVEGYEFIEDLRDLLDEVSQPIYFISDLRKGQITDVQVLRQLGDLTKHEHWAGSTAFSELIASKVFVNVFTSLAQQRTREIWPTAQEALAYLESVAPGVTADIDWDNVLSDGHAQA